MREVLCVAYSCPPILDPQSILLSKMLGPLRSLGYRFHIVGLDATTATARTDPSLRRLLPTDVEIARVSASEKRLWFRVITRLVPALTRLPDKHLPVHFRAVKAGIELSRRFPTTVLFSWAQYHSCSLAALGLKRTLGLPWVAHFSDPWRGNPYFQGNSWERKINARLEESVISSADAVVFVNEETRDWTMAHYPDSWKQKTYVIPHCFAPGLYPRRTAPHPGMIFRHIGSFYGDRGPEFLLRAIAHLRRATPGVLEGVRIEFIGRVRPVLVAKVREMGLEDVVHLCPAVGYLESLREMREADVLLLLEAPSAENLFLPSKLIDYLGAHRPILALTPSRGPAPRLLNDPEDRVVSPEDVEAIALALGDYVRRYRRGELATFRRPSDSVSPFHREKTMASLGALFDRVLHERSRMTQGGLKVNATS